MTSRTKFGLIGKNISYSFSRNYFLEKFKKLNLKQLEYKNYDIPEIQEFPFIIYQRRDEFRGFNVTIPYKTQILPYLDIVDPLAAEIGAVNTVKISNDDKLIGYNTDIFGFQKSIEPLLKNYHKKALVLGTGGASKAIVQALKNLNIEHQYVSRNEGKTNIVYTELNDEIIKEYTLIVNCTPLGTHPDVTACPPIPYDSISNNHLLFDLIYNPSTSLFLKNGIDRGAIGKNGLEMLELQAEKSWEIWNS